jgi:hypothetical protein
MAVDSAAGRRVTSWGAVALGLLSAVAAQRYAVAVAADIGSLAGYEQAWFAGLLEALLDWWNGLGPGGQAMVGLGLLALFGGGMLILAPQVIIGTGVIGVTGAGTITTGAIVIPAGVTTAAGTVVAATGVAMVGSGATSGDGESEDGGDGKSDNGEVVTQWIDDAGNIRWPPNSGFAGTPVDDVLEVGTRIDRYGRPSGSFVSPQDTPYSARSLAPGTDPASLRAYEVIKPIEGVRTGQVAPWFDEVGLGVQHKLPKSVQWLLDNGYLRKLP